MEFKTRGRVETSAPVSDLNVANKRSKGRPPPPKKRNAEWDKVPCVLCNKSYRTVAYLRKHLVAKHRVCTPVVQLKCEFCGFVFSDSEQFRCHADQTAREIANETGILDDVRQEQLEFSRTLRRMAREEVQIDEASKRDLALRVAETFFDCDSGEAPAG